jgi:hypothetical protein
LWTDYPSGKIDGQLFIVAQQIDYGDLPNAYATLIADNGPGHVIGSLWLGQSISAESDGQPSNLADLDTFDDGVVRNPSVHWQPGVTAQITVTVHGDNGYLDGWFDWNDNGAFDSGEMIPFGNVVNGVQSLAVPIPNSYSTGQSLYARFRLYEGNPGTPLPVGVVTNGEVEDYLWTFGPTAVGLSSFGAGAEGGLPAGVGWSLAGLLLVLGLWGFSRRLRHHPAKRSDSLDGSSQSS